MKQIETGLEEGDLIKIVELIKKNNQILEVILFGSRAKGSFHEGSDVDLAIKGNNITLNDILDLANDLDNLNLPYKFDLVCYDKIKEKELIDHINRVGITLF